MVLFFPRQSARLTMHIGSYNWNVVANSRNDNSFARVMKLVNIGDLKSLAVRLVGSSPTTGTNSIRIYKKVFIELVKKDVDIEQ